MYTANENAIAAQNTSIKCAMRRAKTERSLYLALIFGAAFRRATGKDARATATPQTHKILEQKAG